MNHNIKNIQIYKSHNNTYYEFKTFIIRLIYIKKLILILELLIIISSFYYI